MLPGGSHTVHEHCPQTLWRCTRGGHEVMFRPSVVVILLTTSNRFVSLFKICTQ